MEVNFSLIVTLIIGGVGTLLWYLITKQIKAIEDAINDRKKDLEEYKKETKEDIKLIWNEMKEFKENYLDRFEKVNTNINSSRETILDMMHELDKKIK